MTNYVCSRLSASRSFEQSYPFHRCQVTYGITKLALRNFEDQNLFAEHTS